MEPLISVIIPIYNMEAYLARCLDSVLSNTYRNLEVICVDDGSKDSSAEILRAYAEKDSRIVPIFKENGGVSSARNAGLDRMTGEYVTFVDPDDYVHPQYVELLYQALQESGTEIAICGLRRVDPEELLEDQGEIDSNSGLWNSSSCVKVFKNHELRSYCGGRLIYLGPALKVRFREDIRYAEDSLFFAEVCGAIRPERMAVVSTRLYYYAQRENSLTKTVQTAQQILVARAFVSDLQQPSGCDEIFLDQAIKRCLSLRYLASHILPDRAIECECTGMLKRLQRRLRITKIYGVKEKTVYLILIHFPSLYWLFRSVKEPDMWAWEKRERKKRREAKKNNTNARLQNDGCWDEESSRE